MKINKYIYYINCLLLLVFIFLGDYISKQAFEGSVYAAYNTGMSFSALSDYPVVLATITSIIILVLIVMIAKAKNYYLGIPLCFVAGGGLGNLNDRFQNYPYYGKGAVIDFINYGFFVGNLADISIVAGIIVFVINYSYVVKHKRTKS
ncbi:MAG: signal peptidase II [Bifidobacteriaceae bacterium]|jgi:lipoprotein signal peptidase|nr:signal peptidase II [Bifidobacteriaceae bacterium]